MLCFLQVLSTAVEPKVAKWTRICPLKNDKNAINKEKKAKLPNRPVFTPPQRGFLLGGQISMIGVERAPVAIINFVSNPCENL